jgi:cytochrome c-type biogenesis protein CcmH
VRRKVRRKEKGERRKEKGFFTFHFSLFTLSFSVYFCLSLVSLTQAQDVPPSLESKVFEIARELRCPVCTAESVGDSSSQISVEMRNVIQEQLQQGKSKQEILDFFQERYGDWILLDPPKRGVHLLVWVLPIVAALIGLTLLIILFRRWTQKSKAPIDVSSDDLERVREEMKWQE